MWSDRSQNHLTMINLIRISLLPLCVFTLLFPAFAQDAGGQQTEEIPLFSLTTGEAEFIDVDRAYLLEGEKVERFLQSDFYRSEGALNLEEGSWSLIVSGLGGDDETTYGGRDFPNADIELNASPSRCISELNVSASKAFRVTCPLRSLKFEIRSDSSHTLLLITQLSRANALTITLTPTNTPTSTLTFTPTNTPSITPTPTITSTSTPTLTPSITPTPTITPTSTRTSTPTPSRTPRPTAHPDAGTYHISRSGGVNVRSCASTSCSIVAQYDYGRDVQVESFEDGQAVGSDTRWARTIEGNYIHVSLLNKGARPPTVTPTRRPTARPRVTSAPQSSRTICDTQKIIDELHIYTASYGRCNVDGAYMRASVVDSSCIVIYNYWTDKQSVLERTTERRRFAQFIAFLNDEHDLNLDIVGLQTWDKSCTIDLGWEIFDGNGNPVIG